jgi:multidrug efflux pump subunit AcrA (membrane-fusion protein)
MGDQIEELIKEIVVKHGIAVARDDPILVLQTINNRLMLESSRAQQIQLDLYKEELEDLALRWGKDPKAKAERILNAALSASRETMGREMQEGARTLSEAVRAELDAELAAVLQPICNAWRMALFNVVASCITLLAAGVALWIVFRGVK